MPFVKGIVATSLLFFLQPLYAAVASSASPALAGKGYQEPFNTGSIVQLLAGLLLVVALIFVLGWALKRVSGLPGQHKKLNVVATLPLSTREKVVLIQAGEKQLLLGVAPGRVNLLESFDTPVIEPGASGEFANRLQQVLKRREAE